MNYAVRERDNDKLEIECCQETAHILSMITQGMHGRGHSCVPGKDGMLSPGCMVPDYTGNPEGMGESG